MTDEPVCATCGGRGWLKDGTSHGVVCLDCADPVVLRAVADGDAIDVHLGRRRIYSKGGARAGGAVHPRGRRRR